jgi:catechol 2,3-dioxygenase-like lactoylglutathione lyase family enzyme
MSHDVENLHHIGLITRNFPATVARYEQLGFSFTPSSVPEVPLSAGGPPEPLGVANRCAIFTTNYLEILGVIDPARWSAITRAQRGPYDIDPALARYEGLHVLHLASNNLDRTRDRLIRQGFQTSPIRPFQRMVETPDGARLMRARSLAFPSGSDPEALVQIAQHDTPELVLQPRFMAHPNGATAISGVILCVTDPERVAKKYAAYSGHQSQWEGKGLVVELGEARLTIVRPQDLTMMLSGETAPTAPFLAGFTVRGDPRRAVEFLRSREIRYEAFAGRIIVRARDACGTAVLFEGMDKES